MSAKIESQALPEPNCSHESIASLHLDGHSPTILQHQTHNSTSEHPPQGNSLLNSFSEHDYPHTSNPFEPEGEMNTLPSFSRLSLIIALTNFLNQGMTPPSSAPTSPDPTHPHSRFHAIVAPPLSLYNYIERQIEYTHCSPSIFLAALIYILRINSMHPKTLPLTDCTIHRLLAPAISLAVKLFEDRVFPVGHYARVSGLQSKKELIELQLEFMKSLNFHLFVNDVQFAAMKRLLLNYNVRRTPTRIIRQPVTECSHEINVEIENPSNGRAMKRTLQHGASRGNDNEGCVSVNSCEGSFRSTVDTNKRFKESKEVHA